MQEINWLINICFTIFMVGLFVLDYRSFGESTHKDFKTIIMSTGVLGTFVGIFVGLMGFDTLALQDSVPLLLDGLKTAFYTSILGMGLAIALSITQRMKGAKSSEEISMDNLLMQVDNLNTLPRIQKSIEESLEHIRKLPNRTDTLENATSTNALLEQGLHKIDLSLQEAIKQLASGASKELIAALELVIRDFNHNLQNQFGDNFKELNSAVAKLLEWQENYKQHIEDTQTLLRHTKETIDSTASAMSNTQHTLQALGEQNTSAMEFYAKSLNLIDEMKARGDVLQAQLSEVSELGENARLCLGNMESFFTQATHGLNTLSEHANKSIEGLQDTFRTHLNQLDEHVQDNIHTLRNFLQTSVQHTQENSTQILENQSSLFRTQCDTLTHESSELFKSLIHTTKEQIQNVSHELEKNIAQNIESNTQNSAEFARLREHIAKNHTAILESIESSLSRLHGYNEKIMQDMAQGLKNMQEMYLSTLSTSMDSLMGKEQEMIQSRLDSLGDLASKTDNNLNMQYENVSKFLKKMASEYLKIMQKLTKDSVAIPKDMGMQVVKDFGDLQHNLLAHLGNLNAQIQHNSVQLIELYRNVQNILNENIEGNKSLQEEIKGTFNSLDESMNESMKNFKENYEWFLRRVQEIIGSR